MPPSWTSIERVSRLVLVVVILMVLPLSPGPKAARAPGPDGGGAPLSQLQATALAACRCQQRLERTGAADPSPCWREFWRTAAPLKPTNLAPRCVSAAQPAAICVRGAHDRPYCLTLRWQTAHGVLCTRSEALSVLNAQPAGPSSASCI